MYPASGFFPPQEATVPEDHGESMNSSTAVGAVRSAVAALNDGNIDGYLRHFDPSCPRWAAGLAQPLTLTDIGDNLRLLHAAFDGLHLGEDLLFGDERFACARWRLRGRHVRDYLGFAPKGRSIDVETCEVYEVSGGLVITTWVYGDLGQLFRQIAEEGDVA
jgi:predicted ester cyclase